LNPALLSPASSSPTAQPAKADGSFQDALAQASSAQPSKIDDAAKQFEALMLGQILKAARQSSDGGWLGTGEDQSGALALDMAEQQFAQAMSLRGGLGLAKMVTAGLERGAAKAATSGSPAAAPATPTSTDSPQ
jgi:Rod binding domain-containing protein